MAGVAVVSGTENENSKSTKGDKDIGPQARRVLFPVRLHQGIGGPNIVASCRRGIN